MKHFLTSILLIFSIQGFSQILDTVYINSQGSQTDLINYNSYQIIRAKGLTKLEVSEYYKGDSLKTTFFLKCQNTAKISNKNYWKLYEKKKIFKDGEQLFYSKNTKVKRIAWINGVIAFGPVFYKNNTEFFIEKTDTIYLKVDRIPEFSNSQYENFEEYIAKNIVYPEVAKKHSIEGKVHVRFIVHENGNVFKPEIVKGVDPSLDYQAFKAVKNSPNWKPGYLHGRPVSFQLVIPVNFELD